MKTNSTSSYKLLFLTLLFLIFGCSPFTYKDLELPEDIKPGVKGPEDLTKEQVAEDREILKFILNEAYAGRFVIPKKVMDQALANIDKISGAMKTQEFCDKAGQALSLIPDFHLHIRNKGTVCSRAKERPESTVGKNLAKKAQKTWLVEKRSSKNKNFLYIAISRFPSHKSKKWDGFLNEVKKYHNPTLPVVLDLRSNGGGDDTFGYRLSAFFHKSEGEVDFPNPYDKQLTGQTAETQVLKVNVAKYWLRGDVSERELLESHLKEQEKLLKEILNGGLPEVRVDYNDPIPEGWEFSGFPNKIFILIDENCYSSCESTVDTFEYNPNVKRVGRATGGMVHFGNVSPAFLRHSKLYVQTPTHANIYRDGRFIEKVGIQPDITVDSGTDALDFVLKNLL